MVLTSVADTKIAELRENVIVLCFNLCVPVSHDILALLEEALSFPEGCCACFEPLRSGIEPSFKRLEVGLAESQVILSGIKILLSLVLRAGARSQQLLLALL